MSSMLCAGTDTKVYAGGAAIAAPTILPTLALRLDSAHGSSTLYARPHYENFKWVLPPICIKYIILFILNIGIE